MKTSLKLCSLVLFVNIILGCVYFWNNDTFPQTALIKEGVKHSNNHFTITNKNEV